MPGESAPARRHMTPACHRCGAPLRANTPGGHCPRCLLQLASLAGSSRSLGLSPVRADMASSSGTSSSGTVAASSSRRRPRTPPCSSLGCVATRSTVVSAACQASAGFASAVARLASAARCACRASSVRTLAVAAAVFGPIPLLLGGGAVSGSQRLKPTRDGPFMRHDKIPARTNHHRQQRETPRNLQSLFAGRPTFRSGRLALAL